MQSVHLAGPKVALLLAAYEVALVGDEGAHSYFERPVMQQILAEPNAEVALSRFVDFVAESHVRVAEIGAALRVAADAEPIVRDELVAQTARRHATLEFGADWLISRGLIEPSKRQTVADHLGFITSEQSYLYFVVECGWSIERYRDWLLESIQGAISTKLRF